MIVAATVCALLTTSIMENWDHYQKLENQSLFPIAHMLSGCCSYKYHIYGGQSESASAMIWGER